MSSKILVYYNPSFSYFITRYFYIYKNNALYLKRLKALYINKQYFYKNNTKDMHQLFPNLKNHCLVLIKTKKNKKKTKENKEISCILFLRRLENMRKIKYEQI